MACPLTLPRPLTPPDSLLDPGTAGGAADRPEGPVGPLSWADLLDTVSHFQWRALTGPGPLTVSPPLLPAGDTLGPGAPGGPGRVMESSLLLQLNNFPLKILNSLIILLDDLLQL